MTEFESTQWLSKLYIEDPLCADANLKFELDISISLRDMKKETDSEGMNCCIPPVSEFLKSFNFWVSFYVMRWPSSNQPKYSFGGPLYADANIKCEIHISNGLWEMAKEIV